MRQLKGFFQKWKFSIDVSLCSLPYLIWGKKKKKTCKLFDAPKCAKTALSARARKTPLTEQNAKYGRKKMYHRFQFQLWTTHNVMHVTSLIPFVCISFDSLLFLCVSFSCASLISLAALPVCVSSQTLAAYSAYFFRFVLFFLRSYSAHIISFYVVCFFLRCSFYFFYFFALIWRKNIVSTCHCACLKFSHLVRISQNNNCFALETSQQITFNQFDMHIILWLEVPEIRFRMNLDRK